MRVLPFFISTVLTIVLVFALSHKWGTVPPIGKFLSPQQGFWQNAEPTDENYNQDLHFSNLKGKATVYLDTRLVPHVFAEKDEDVYFIQGYLHAKFRLWQMEFQTLAAAGRVSEKIGSKPEVLRYDREQRRLGMVYAAENTVKAMEQDTSSKQYFDAYTAGVNAYIHSLTESQIPIEYKLLDYRPEDWTNLKTALFLKMMSKELAGYERDLEFTNEKSVFSLAEMKMLFPDVSDSSKPIISAGTAFSAASIVPVKPASADSLYFGKDTTVTVKEENKPNPNNGSNNWAVSGQKTASGAPILCNDPHLHLTLPSIWFEMQLTTGTMNAYGATFPGSPGVIIGFNDSIAFGFTNAMRDVKDYYKIKFKDDSRKEYWFNNAWQTTTFKIEEVKIAGAPTLYDTVAYTIFGPVMYDHTFTHKVTGSEAIAVRWTAHDPSNEGAMFFKLNRAKNYNEYLSAIKYLNCPGQNMLFASKSGDIALWQQGKFPARWQGQGLFLMPGEDSSYMWQGFIPQSENPHVLNPPEGFIQSANQRPVDSTYPYFIPGNYITPRGRTIYNQLQQMQNITPQMMMALQNSYYNSLAADAVPLILKNIDSSHLSTKEQQYIIELRNWNYYSAPDSKGATVYQAMMDYLREAIVGDEIARVKGAKDHRGDYYPDEQTLVEMLLKDSANRFIDDITTPQVETLQQEVTKALHNASNVLEKEESENGLVWWKHKNSYVEHILRIPALSHRNLQVGGWAGTPNAITRDHGPSWRMVVQLSNPTLAYGIYPGGQSGNPGSRFYDNFTDDWARGNYYTLWVMKENEANDKRVIAKMTFSNN